MFVGAYFCCRYMTPLPLLEQLCSMSLPLTFLLSVASAVFAAYARLHHRTFTPMLSSVTTVLGYPLFIPNKQWGTSENRTLQ